MKYNNSLDGSFMFIVIFWFLMVQDGEILDPNSFCETLICSISFDLLEEKSHAL